uniref:Uncharacterized protein LOC114347450 n=1 Tax=Diabrotica virgifera virgifera TaxID=50390 RepID=A0A6P7GWU8_DIAVI
MIKQIKDLQILKSIDPTSTDVYKLNIFEKYSNRVLKENVSLADFAVVYKQSGIINKNVAENEDAIDNDDNEKRQKPMVIRYRHYKFDQDAHNYYREQILLFHPWRNELDEVENIDCKSVYEKNLQQIEENRKKYVIYAEETIENAIEIVTKVQDNDDEIQEFENDKLTPMQQVDILVQAGKEISKDVNKTRFTCPPRVTGDEMLILLEKLNDRQREIVMYLHFTLL